MSNTFLRIIGGGLKRCTYAKAYPVRVTPYDNAVAENFFSCLKCERVYLQHYATRKAAQADIFLYIEAYYNSVRPHSAIGWISPYAFEQKLISAA